MTGPSLSRRGLVLGGVALAASGLGRPAHAQLKLDITRGVVEPMPIAISPLAGDNPQAKDMGDQIARLVSADLDGSGLFKTIDRRSYIQSPDEMRDAPRFADWRQLDAQGLVTGVVRSTGNGLLSLDFRLWDVFGGMQLKGLRLETGQAQWRRLAHKIADAVYERLTGETGYFDTRMVYVSETGPATRRIKRIAVMDQDGANHAFLTDGSNLVLTPRLSPDNSQVAYMAFRSPVPRVFLRDIASGRETVLGDFAGMSFSPRFSPDGGTLLMSLTRDGDADLYAMDMGSRRFRQLTDGNAIDTSPSFSPDGRQIVFTSDRGGSQQLYLMGAGGGGIRRLSFGQGRYGDPEWSPRGDMITFSKIQNGMLHIGVMRPDGSDERLLTRSPLDEGPNWSPNGRVIVFGRKSGPGGRARLFTIDVTGYNVREIPTPLDASDPDWSTLLP